MNSQYVDRKKCELFQNNWIFQYLTLSFYTFNFTAVALAPRRGASEATRRIKLKTSVIKKKTNTITHLSALLHLIVVWKTPVNECFHRGFFITSRERWCLLNCRRFYRVWSRCFHSIPSSSFPPNRTIGLSRWIHNRRLLLCCWRIFFWRNNPLLIHGHHLGLWFGRWFLLVRLLWILAFSFWLFLID